MQVTVTFNFDLLHNVIALTILNTERRTDLSIMKTSRISKLSALNYLNNVWNDQASFQDHLWCWCVRSYHDASQKRERWLIAESSQKNSLIGRLKKRRQKTWRRWWWCAFFVWCEISFILPFGCVRAGGGKRDTWIETLQKDALLHRPEPFHISLKWVFFSSLFHYLGLLTFESNLRLLKQSLSSSCVLQRCTL